MKNKKRLLIGITLLAICLVGMLNVFAHSGRTDANGGHRDNNNKSGLGGYHYHCGGYPAHSHAGGVCPYKTKVSSSISSSSTSNKYDEGYDDGYDEGYDKGYDEGYDKGYDVGFDEGKKTGHAIGLRDGRNEKQDQINKILWISIPLIGVIILLLCYKAFFSKRKQE